jgi:hypothetical protein
MSYLSIVDPVPLAKRLKCPNMIPLNEMPSGPKGGNPPVFGSIDPVSLKQLLQGEEVEQCIAGNSVEAPEE